MGLRSTIRALATNPIPSTPPAAGVLARAGGARSTSSPAPGRVNPTSVPYLTGTTALGLSAVWRCVTLIADTIADWPWTEWRGDDELEPSRLIRRPLVSMNRREWTWRVVATEALFNVAHVLHVGGYDTEGLPWSLLPIPPAAIAPADMPDPWGMLPPTRYTVGNMNVDAELVTCIRRAPFPGVTDNIAGILSIARQQFTSYLAADTAAARYWMNGGPITTVLTSDEWIDDTEAATLAQRWVDRRSMGADYPVVTGKGAKAAAWGADPTAEASVEARREMVADVGRFFGFPTRILNAPAGDSETYSNVENDAVDLYRYTLRGYASPLEAVISDLLPGAAVGQSGRRMQLDPSGFLSGDLASRATAYSTLTGAGIMSVPEARRRGFGLPPTPRDVAPAAAAEPLPAAFATVDTGAPAIAGQS